MRSVIVPSKRLAEKLTVVFPFGDQLLFGEVISGALVTCVVSVGTDATPANVIFGAAVVSGKNVSQVVTGGVAGVVYELVCAASGSTGTTYAKTAKLAVVDNPRAMQGP